MCVYRAVDISVSRRLTRQTSRFMSVDRRRSESFPRVEMLVSDCWTVSFGCRSLIVTQELCSQSHTVSVVDQFPTLGGYPFPPFSFPPFIPSPFPHPPLFSARGSRGALKLIQGGPGGARPPNVFWRIFVQNYRISPGEDNHS